MRYELEIAARYLLTRHRSRSVSMTTVFTGLGIGIGVAALCIVLSVMDGFEANLRQRILRLTPPVEVTSLRGPIAEYDALVRQIASVPGVSAAAPFLNSQGMLGTPHGISGVLVRAMQPDSPVIAANVRKSMRIVAGSLDSLLQTYPGASHDGNAAGPIGAIAIGQALAEKLKVKVGDQVRIISPILAADRNQLRVRAGQFVLGATFNSGVSFLDRNLVLMDLRPAQEFFGRDGKVDGIQVYLTDLDQTDAVTRKLQALLSFPYVVRNWAQINQAYSAGFAMLKRVYSLVLAVLIGVAAFNLVATLIMTGIEKRRDVAILMTMGASARSVKLIFLYNALLLGASGTLGGLALGLIGALALRHYHFIRIPEEIYGTSTLPVAIHPGQFGAVALVALALCLVAGLYPARQASRRLPVEVMRRD